MIFLNTSNLNISFYVDFLFIFFFAYLNLFSIGTKNFFYLRQSFLQFKKILLADNTGYTFWILNILQQISECKRAKIRASRKKPGYTVLLLTKLMAFLKKIALDRLKSTNFRKVIITKLANSRHFFMKENVPVTDLR